MNHYHADLRALPDWDAYLLEHSGLPGPRGNLELAQAAADLATPEQIEHWLSFDAMRAPVNTPGEFLAFCGTVALGRLLAEGDDSVLARPVLTRLQSLANDPRWRTREGVAMALQRLGDADMARLVHSVQPWANGSLYEQRAAAAALCEPRLLTQPQHAQATLDLLDQITQAIPDCPDEKSPAFEALRKGLGYCWSVAVAALPEAGKPRLAAWASHPNRHIHWIVRENLKKNRLVRMDAQWVERVRALL